MDPTLVKHFGLAEEITNHKTYKETKQGETRRALVKDKR